mgnify:CR=1 FL=1
MAADKKTSPTNGLRTFALHAYDQSSSSVVEELEQQTAQSFSAGATPVTPETAARAYLANAVAHESGRTAFEPISTEPVPLTGTVAVKFRQRFNDVPVYGSLVTVELDENNRLVAINGSLGEPSEVSPVPAKSPAQAIEAIQHHGGSKKDLAGVAPDLEYYFDPRSASWRLVYIVKNVKRDKAPHIVDYVVDAHTGEVVAELPRHSPQS